MFDQLIPLYLYLGYPVPRPEHLYDYVLAEQGLIKRVETRFASAELLLVPIAERLIGLHLQHYPLQSLRLKVPRIPGRLLVEALADARQNLGLEYLYHFRFNPVQGWRVTRPEQAQIKTWVGYEEPNQDDIVLELHSHNDLDAFFSPTDDRDEQGGRFYAVMGQLDRPSPQLALRQGLYGHWQYHLPALSLFDDLGPFVEVYPAAPPVVGKNNLFAHFFNWR